LAGAAEAALAVGPSTLPVNGRRLGYLASSAIPKHTSLLTVSQMLKLLIKLTTINCKSSKTKQTKTQNQKKLPPLETFLQFNNSPPLLQKIAHQQSPFFKTCTCKKTPPPSPPSPPQN
jgi:hypothetical protein